MLHYIHFQGSTTSDKTRTCALSTSHDNLQHTGLGNDKWDRELQAMVCCSRYRSLSFGWTTRGADHSTVGTTLTSVITKDHDQQAGNQLHRWLINFLTNCYWPMGGPQNQCNSIEVTRSGWCMYNCAGFRYGQECVSNYLEVRDHYGSRLNCNGI